MEVKKGQKVERGWKDMVSDFEELLIYQQSRALAKQVYDITRQGEFKYDTRFVQQMRASSGSISDNIAEGFER